MTLDKNKKRTYSVEQYDPGWVLKFEEIKTVLEKIFGTKALAIEHIGSTSIAGVSAKPVIDVLVVVEKMEQFSSEKEQMLKFGYESENNYIAPDTIIFFKTIDGDRKTENIHVCVKDSDKAIQFITTRDYLRAHAERAEEYSTLKQELNKKFPNDYPDYRAAKQNFLDETEELTKEWLDNRLTR